MTIIKSISYDQSEIINNIINLYLKGEKIHLDPTYSKGMFYKNTSFGEPIIKSDLYPKTKDTIQCEASDLPFADDEINSIMFDPPFLAGYTKEAPTGIMGKRFFGFRYLADLWNWYEKCLCEFSRVLKNDGYLIFKCQDTVSSGRQHLSHVFIINTAEKFGFYCQDIFILLANNRMIGHNHKIQKHSRKYHSYFLVFRKVRK